VRLLTRKSLNAIITYQTCTLTTETKEKTPTMPESQSAAWWRPTTRRICTRRKTRQPQSEASV